MTSIYRDALLSQLRTLRNIPINELDADTAGDLFKVKLNQALTPEERVRSLLEQVRNPYFYKHGDVMVKISFADNGKTLQACMEDYLAAELQIKE